MAGALWVVAETGPNGLSRLSMEIATLGRKLAETGGVELLGVVAGPAPDEAATELARFLPRVASIAVPGSAELAQAAVVATAVAALAESVPGAGLGPGPDVILTGADPDGRDIAGMLSALLEWGILANASAVEWADGPVVEMTAFGGQLITSSRLTGLHGIVTVRLGATVAEACPQPGRIESMALTSDDAARHRLPPVAVLDRVTEAGAAAPIEEARVIVAGGRGVGGPDGFRLVSELAEALGGVVGATRAAVDAGWIPYARQIGQTGKVVKPDLYVALGISGAIQHKVGMQTAGTIVAINRDADAPIGEYADLLVVGDLFEVTPALVAAIRARAT